VRKLIALTALLVAATPVLAQGSIKVKIAKLYLSGDRIIEGEITAEDDTSITIKTDVAEAPLQKADIVYTSRSEMTLDEIKEKKRAKSVYTSLLLGYRIRKPDDWTFKFDPPEPLSDVLVRQNKESFELAVFGVPDQHEDVALDDDALKGFEKTTEAKLREKFLDVKRMGSSTTKVKDRPALFLEFSMTKKEGKKDFKQGEFVFRNKGKVLFFSVWGPAAKYDKAKAVLDDVLATLEFTEANAQEGNRLFSQEFLFSLEKPSDWTFAKGSEIVAPKEEATIKVEPKKLEASLSLEAWSRDLEPAPHAGGKKVSAGSANVCGRLGYQWTFEYPDGSRKRRLIQYAIKEQERGYVITADYPLDKELFGPVVSEAMSKFRVLNSLLAEGALEKGLEAIEAFDAGDKKLDQKDYAGAIELYEKAVATYPRYANAWNNRGIAHLRAGETEKARHAFQRAYDFFPEDPLVRNNLALGQLGEAMELLRDKKGEEAQRLIERARSLAPPDSEAAKADFAVAYDNLAIHYANKENWSQAASWLEKGLQLKPKDPELTKNLVAICDNAAVSAYNKHNESGASSWANKALKYDPQNAKAKEILGLLKKK
jgi:Flp pilus assembly protein TadD